MMDLSDLNILLVEDNKINMMLTRKLVEKTGCTTAIAYSGEEALSILREQRFDCVFTDIQMPQMNGLELARKIRELGIENTPIIAMTGYVGDDEKTAMKEAGINDILAKPFSFEELVTTISKNCKN
ncbi:MAG: response regulator [Bacteroidota bacterium]|jgi:CheY-like chemotaxis protein